MKHHYVLSLEPVSLDVPGVEALCGRIVQNPEAIMWVDLGAAEMPPTNSLRDCTKCAKEARQRQEKFPSLRYWLYFVIDGEDAMHREAAVG